MNNNRSIASNEILNKSACIKKFYNYKLGKYYDINDANFVWPVIKHGASNPNTNSYCVLIRKCENSNFRKKHFEECSSQEDIDAYIKTPYISLTIVDSYIDVLNYENPINKFLYSITSAIAPDSYSTNNINFNPTKIRSFQGLIRDNYVEEISYRFNQNSKSNTISENTKILGSFYFWIQNSQQYYERHYQKITDIFSTIGGTLSVVFMIAKIINYFITRFIILLDTQELIFNVKKSNYVYEKLIKRPSLRKFLGEIPSKSVKIQQEGTDEGPGTINKTKTQDLIKSGIIDKKENDNLEGSTNRDIINIENNNSNLPIIDQNKNVSRKNNKISKDNKNNKDEEFGWCQFFFYLTHLKRSNPKIRYYEELREQIISEENLFQNYINTYNLLKMNKMAFKKRVI